MLIVLIAPLLFGCNKLKFLPENGAGEIHYYSLAPGEIHEIKVDGSPVAVVDNTGDSTRLYLAPRIVFNPQPGRLKWFDSFLWVLSFVVLVGLAFWYFRK